MPEKVFIALDDVRVATPCNADWNAMRGDERTRFCATCAKNVYNLSEMSRAAAMTLVREKEGHLCVRFYRREDGTMLTDDCPVGLRAVRRPLRWMAGTMALFLTPLLDFRHRAGRRPTGKRHARHFARSRRAFQTARGAAV